MLHPGHLGVAPLHGLNNITTSAHKDTKQKEINASNPPTARLSSSDGMVVALTTGVNVVSFISSFGLDTLRL